MATTYVLRRNDGAVWLKQESPAVAWGPKAQACRFVTKGEARRAATRLGRYGPLALEALEAEPGPDEPSPTNSA